MYVVFVYDLCVIYDISNAQLILVRLVVGTFEWHLFRTDIERTILIQYFVQMSVAAMKSNQSLLA